MKRKLNKSTFIALALITIWTFIYSFPSSATNGAKISSCVYSLGFLREKLETIRDRARAEIDQEYLYPRPTKIPLYAKGEAIEILEKRYSVVELLGLGSQGRVYKVRGEDGLIYALKILYPNESAKIHIEDYKFAGEQLIPSAVIKAIAVDPVANGLVFPFEEGVTFSNVEKNRDFFTDREIQFIEQAFKEFRSKLKRPWPDDSNILIRIKDFSFVIIDPT